MSYVVLILVIVLSALAALRYKAVKSRSLDFIDRLSERYSFGSEAFQIIKIIFWAVVSRAFLLLMCYIVTKTRNPDSSVLSLLAENGDVPHYIHIAEHGYSVGDEFENRIVFFPVFPYLMRFVNYLIGNMYVSGAVISNIAAIFSCVYMYKLVRIDYDRDIANDAVLFFMIYPFSFFMLFTYTDSLFIMLCIMCIYYGRKKSWIVSGILGFFASFTRTQGIILFGLCAYEYVITTLETAKNTKGYADKKAATVIRSFSLKGIALILIPAGYACYLGLNYKLFHNAFKFREFQRAAPWYNDTDFFGKNLAQHIGMASEYTGLGYIIYLPQVVMFFVALTLAAYGIRKHVRTSYLLHIAAYTVISFTPSWLISGPRYMLSCILMCIPLSIASNGILVSKNDNGGIEIYSNNKSRNRYFRAAALATYFTLFFYYYITYLFKHAIM